MKMIKIVSKLFNIFTVNTRQDLDKGKGCISIFRPQYFASISAEVDQEGWVSE